jgi:hypothetical protein
MPRYNDHSQLSAADRKTVAPPESIDQRSPLKDFLRNRREKAEVKSLNKFIELSDKLDAEFAEAQVLGDARKFAAEANISKKEALGRIVAHRAERDAALEGAPEWIRGVE